MNHLSGWSVSKPDDGPTPINAASFSEQTITVSQFQYASQYTSLSPPQRRPPSLHAPSMTAGCFFFSTRNGFSITTSNA